MNDQPPKVSILIVAFNSRPIIEQCLDSILQFTTKHDFEIVFVDNGSDQCEDLVRSKYHQVRVLPSRGNIGFGAANNYLAEGGFSEYILLINPDTWLVDESIDLLIDFADENPVLAAVGGRTITPTGTFDGGNRLEIPSIPGFCKQILGFAAEDVNRTTAINLSAPYSVDILCGGFMMMRRRTWEQLGGFDEGFFLYFEEVDLFLRLKRSGLGRAGVKPNCVIVHDVGSGEQFSVARTIFQLTGRMHFVAKHWTATQARIGFVLTWIWVARRFAQGAILGLFSPRQRAMRRAYGQALFNPRRWRSGYPMH